MQNRYENLADKVRDSGIMVPLGTLLIFLALASVVITYRDFTSNYYGYISRPVNPAIQANKIEAIAVSVAIQGLASLSVYTAFLMTPQFQSEVNLRRLVIAMAVLMHVTDIYYGYIYYIHPDAKNVIPFFSDAYKNNVEIRNMVNNALIDSALIDTLLSEIMTSWVFGMLVHIWPDYIKQLENVMALKKLPKKKESKKKVGEQGGRRGSSKRRSPQRTPAAPAAPASQHASNNTGRSQGEQFR